MRVFESYSLVDIPYDCLYVRNIPLSGCMDRRSPYKGMICKHFYWPDIRYDVQKEVTNCDNCQCTELSNKKHGKLPAKLAEEIPWNKLYVDIIGTYTIKRKVNK